MVFEILFESQLGHDGVCGKMDRGDMKYQIPNIKE